MKKYSPDELREVLAAVEKIVAQVGREVREYAGPAPYDTGTVRGHEESTIDDFARMKMQIAIDKYLPELEGIIRLELRPFEKSFLEGGKSFKYVLIIDEIEGTTNTKRCLASPLSYRPLAGVSLAVLLSETLEDLVVGAFFTMASGNVYSSILSGQGSFMSFLDGKRLEPDELVETAGDSKKRIYVIGYSNSHRIKKGELEQALWDAGFKVYDGCRASGVDITSLIRGQIDAYVDLRQTWSTLDELGVEQEAQLQTYDIAGMIPIALGCGMEVSDPTGGDWQSYGLMDAIPLVISRPGIHQKILDIVSPLAQKWHKQAELKRKPFTRAKVAKRSRKKKS